jgi:hypothetical protein
MDEMGDVLVTKLKGLVKADDKSIQLPRWLQNYAFDTVATLCYSKPYGFLEQDVDIDNIISTTRMILDYTAHVRLRSPSMSLFPQHRILTQSVLASPVVRERSFLGLATAEEPNYDVVG